MRDNTFFFDFGVSGPERKRLVRAISAHTQGQAKYLGVPTCAYQVGPFHIDRNGIVSFPCGDDSFELQPLLDHLEREGFQIECSNVGPEDMLRQDKKEVTEAHTAPQEAAHAADTAEGGQDADATIAPDTAPQEANTAGLIVSLPLDGFTPDALERLGKLIDSKATLIRKALGADRLGFQREAETLVFPWWDTLSTEDAVPAYTAFLAALCRMAKEARRVTATEKPVESEKYAFRGFLLRLGFSGPAHKAERTILLEHLTGTAAFPNKAKADAFAAAQKARREAAKAAAVAEALAPTETAAPAEDTEEVVEK